MDSSAFAYKCSDGGGWHEFFDVPHAMVPWSAGREAAEGEACVRHTFETIDALLDSQFGMGWDMWDAAGAKNVRLCDLHACVVACGTLMQPSA